MGLGYMIKTNVFFRDAYEEGFAEGVARARARAKVRAKADLLLGLLTQKYGRVPAWARERLADAREADINRWSARIFAAATLEDAIGKRR